MKAFISVDLEGMPYIVIGGHLNLKGTLYSEARKIATKVTLIAAEELNKNGFEEIVIADSHGPMVNLLVDELPEYVEIVRGYPRPTSMIAGIEGCHAAMFLGYHAKFGTAKSTFDHTYSGRIISRVKINHLEASEFLLNAYAAGELGVPIILVAGEAQLLEDDVKKCAPWTERVALKHSLSRVSARSYSMIRIEKELRMAAKKAITKFKQKKIDLLTARKPVKIEVTLSATHFADAAELLPTVKRVDGLNIEYTAKNIIEAYKTFEILTLAASGMASILETMQ
jgi:D-amino peptidase